MKAKKFRILQFPSSHAGFPKELSKQGSVGSHSENTTPLAISEHQMVRKVHNKRIIYGKI